MVISRSLPSGNTVKKENHLEYQIDKIEALLIDLTLPNLSYHIFRHVSRLPYVNENKMAVSGVSYGGYIATKMLSEQFDNLLTCGVAVSPVVDWRFYGNY